MILTKRVVALVSRCVLPCLFLLGGWTTKSLARPIESVLSNDYLRSGSPGRVWRMLVPGVDPNSFYWKQFHYHGEGPRLFEWLNIPQDYSPKGGGSCHPFVPTYMQCTRMYDMGRLALKTVDEIGKDIVLKVIIPHPTSFDLLELNLIRDIKTLRKPLAFQEFVREKTTISGYNAEVIMWQRGEESRHKECRIILDLPRKILFIAEHPQCGSLAPLKDFVSTINYKRFLNRLDRE